MKKNFQRRLSQIFGLDSINENERKLSKDFIIQKKETLV